MTNKLDWMNGCATALVTPFTADGAIDEAALTRLIEYQLNNGIRLLVPCGTTGESATMTEAVDLPIVVYNVPGRTSCNIAAATTLRLARDCENIVAVKEASGNLSQIMEILRERPEGFRVLSGDDAITFALIALGGDGLISVASNQAPELMSRMVDLALEGKWDEARELHYRLLPLMETNFIESRPGPVKADRKSTPLNS